ncbi:hypothetical protein BKA83DRAFT_4122620 [Pisolithus microcarpus]|nr:hypothetical protein BKA83DRAFT_4122620 [Pisolithus microcarpus]
MSSSEPQVKLHAAWTQVDVEMLLDYAEEIRYKAGRLHGLSRSTYSLIHTKLKREYYVASTIARGSGLAYSTERGTNVVIEAGQLVMDELIETRPEAAQFQNKGFKYWDRMQQFVPRDKARGANCPPRSGSSNIYPTIPHPIFQSSHVVQLAASVVISAAPIHHLCAISNWVMSTHIILWQKV